MMPRYFWVGYGDPIGLLPVSVAEMDTMYSGHPNYFGWPVYYCEDGLLAIAERVEEIERELENRP